MNDLPQIPADLKSLVESSCEEGFSAADQEKLDRAIADNKDVARYYSAYLHMHAELHFAASLDRARDSVLAQVLQPANDAIGDAIDVTPTAVSEVRLRDKVADFFPRHSRVGITVATVLMAAFIATLALIPIEMYRRANDVAESNIEPVAKKEPSGDSAARLVNAVGAKWHGGATTSESEEEQPITSGMKLYPKQRLRLESGIAEFKFFNGAEVVLQGPAEIEIQSPKKCRLDTGSLIASAHERRSKGFIVETPTTTVEDLGTEFGVSVLATGMTRVEVFEGKVKTSPGVGLNGGITMELGTGESIVLAEENRQLVAANTRRAEFDETLGLPPLLRTLMPAEDVRFSTGGLVQSGPGAQYLSVHNIGGNPQRSLIRFDLSSLPEGYEITRAELVLTRRKESPKGPIAGGEDNPHGVPIDVYRVAQPWNQRQVSWTMSRGGQPWRRAGGDGIGRTGELMTEPFASVRANPPIGEAVRFDVTQLAAGWHDGEFDNHGMLLLSGQGNRLHFYASEHPDPRGRPRLVIVLMAKHTSE